MLYLLDNTDSDKYFSWEAWKNRNQMTAGENLLHFTVHKLSLHADCVNSSLYAYIWIKTKKAHHKTILRRDFRMDSYYTVNLSYATSISAVLVF